MNKTIIRILLFTISVVGIELLLGRKYLIGFLIICGLIKLIQIKKRKYFWKDKKGEKLTFKQFIKRFKLGVEGITPLQQTKTSMMGLWITITGMIAGIIVNALIRLTNMWWWIEIILIGSLIISLVQMLGFYQKYRRFKLIDKQLREVKNEKKIQ